MTTTMGDGGPLRGVGAAGLWWRNLHWRWRGNGFVQRVARAAPRARGYQRGKQPTLAQIFFFFAGRKHLDGAVFAVVAALADHPPAADARHGLGQGCRVGGADFF